jgi:hypothetical protein
MGTSFEDVLHLALTFLENSLMSPGEVPDGLWGAQVEAELSELDEDEAKEYLESLGCDEGGLSSLVRLIRCTPSP